MITIKVKFPYFTGLTPEIKNRINIAINQTLIVGRNYWIKKASEKLKSSYLDYIWGLQQDSTITVKDMVGTLTLKGKFPNMIEKGFSSYDIKPFELASSKVKYTKKTNEPYIDIPLRWLNPEANRTAVPGQIMPEDIYTIAKALKPFERLVNTEDKYPPKISHTGYRHKTGLYEGIQKRPFDYEQRTQNQYISFRRISTKSHPLSWIHPGYKGANISQEVSSYIEKIAQTMIDNILGAK